MVVICLKPKGASRSPLNAIVNASVGKDGRRCQGMEIPKKISQGRGWKETHPRLTHLLSLSMFSCK